MKIDRIVFMGTPSFAVPSLKLLIDSGYKPEICITQPDKPKGRKQKLRSPEIKKVAEAYKIKVIQPDNVNSNETFNTLSHIKPKIIITVAYGGYLGRRLRNYPEYGCINLHPSLLPKYRGAAPINHTLFNGDKYTGNTVFKLVAKMDAGPVLYQTRLKIKPEENFSQLSDRLAEDGAKALIRCLEKLSEQDIVIKNQNEAEATYCPKLKKEDMLLSWRMEARVICNKVRGLSYRPGAVACFRGKRIKILKSKILQQRSLEEAGKILELIKPTGIVVSTADQNILIQEVQPEGKRIMSSYAYNLGARIKLGESFESGF